MSAYINRPTPLFLKTAYVQPYPDKLAGQTLMDGQPASRRVMVTDRISGKYVISTLTRADGQFVFLRLPPQNLASPYVVTCFDDRPNNFSNAQIFDHIYQVDDAGNPPQT